MRIDINLGTGDVKTATLTVNASEATLFSNALGYFRMHLDEQAHANPLNVNNDYLALGLNIKNEYIDPLYKLAKDLEGKFPPNK